MTGARFIHDQLELAGWDGLIADAQRVRGLAPLAAKTDKIDAHVLAELTRRALVPEITAADAGRPLRTGSGPAFGSTWFVTARRSRTGSTRS